VKRSIISGCGDGKSVHSNGEQSEIPLDEEDGGGSFSEVVETRQKERKYMQDPVSGEEPAQWKGADQQLCASGGQLF
jgi:hypothetical protein